MRLRVARKVLFSRRSAVLVRFTTVLAAGKRWRKWDRRRNR